MRARVTLVFAVGAAAVLALCLSLLYVALDSQLVEALDGDLRARSGDLAAAIDAGDLTVVVEDPMAQVYGADGNVLVGSAALQGSKLLAPEDVRRVLGDGPESDGGLAPVRTVAVQLAEPRPTEVRLLTRRLAQGQVLAVGVSAEPLHEAGQRLVMVLVLAAPPLVALLAAAGWLTVRAALRPVDMLTSQAAAISSFQDDRRLPAVPGDDEIARLASTLDGMLARLRLAFERERTFIDDASHELRTPIAVLQGELELALSASDEPKEVERSLRAALRESERLFRLAEDLLLLARQGAGSLVVDRKTTDLLDLAATEARRLAPVLGLNIQVTGDPETIDGDPDRLRQVLVNLVHNSAAAGATTVRMRVARDGPSATLEIADDGPGFPPGVLERAFDRFVRGDKARTARSAGAGLGLSIVRAVVVGHDGTVDARNGGPLDGAVVTVSVPLRSHGDDAASKVAPGA